MTPVEMMLRREYEEALAMFERYKAIAESFYEEEELSHDRRAEP